MNTLPLPTTENAAAEEAFREARRAEERGDIEDATALYRDFVSTYAEDPLTPVAHLALGRIALAEGDEARAKPRFEDAMSSPDEAVSERGQLYLGVVAQLSGEHQRALELLRPLEGRLVGREESALLLRTTAAACVQLGERECAVRALDGLLVSATGESERDEAAAELRRIVEQEATEEEISRLYQGLRRDGSAWPLVAERSLRAAFAAGDLPEAAHIASDLRERGVALEGELLAMAERAERTGRGEPGVIGAILPLSGRGRGVGQAALRGIMLATGTPLDGPPTDASVQVVVRDSAADPERAARAVDDLVTLHRVIAIIGPIDASAAERAARRAQDLGVPIITLTTRPSIVDAGDMAFRLFPNPAGEIRALVRAAHTRGVRRFAILYPEHGFGRSMRETYEQAVASHGAEVVEARSYDPSATSFGEAVEALRAGRPEAILVPDRAARVALIAPALAAVGLWTPPEGEETRGERATGARLLVPSVGHDEAMVRQSARYLRGALFSLPFEPSARPASRFHAEYLDRYGSAPSLYAAVAGDAAHLIMAGVDAGATTRRELATRLAGFRASTAASSGGLGGDRQPARETRIFVFRDGGLEPEPASSGGHTRMESPRPPLGSAHALWMPRAAPHHVERWQLLPPTSAPRSLHR